MARYDFLFLAALAIQLAHAGVPAGNAVRSQGHPDLPRRRHGHGDIQDLRRLVDLSGGELFRIGGVPLFSGFMYAAVGSYLARISRIFDMRYTQYPPLWATVLLAVGDLCQFLRAPFHRRYALGAVRGHGAALSSARSCITASSASATACRCWWASCWSRCSSGSPRTSAHGRAPGSILVSTTAGRTFRSSKLGSWYLLMIISFVLVTLVHRPRKLDTELDKEPR